MSCGFLQCQESDTVPWAFWLQFPSFTLRFLHPSYFLAHHQRSFSLLHSHTTTFHRREKKNTVLKKKKDWETKGTWGQTTEWWIEKLQTWLLNRYCAWQMCMMSRHVQVRNQPVHQTHRAVLTFKWRVLASFMSLKFYMAGILKLWYNMGLLQRRFTIIKNYLCEDVFISYLFFSEIRIIKIDHF